MDSRINQIITNNSPGILRKYKYKKDNNVDIPIPRGNIIAFRVKTSDKNKPTQDAADAAEE